MLSFKNLLVGACFGIYASALQLTFYDGTQCNGEEIGYLEITTIDICSVSQLRPISKIPLTPNTQTEYLATAESVLIVRESVDATDTGMPTGEHHVRYELTLVVELAFYSSTDCDTSASPVIFTTEGCVDYSGLEGMSYVIEAP